MPTPPARVIPLHKGVYDMKTRSRAKDKPAGTSRWSRRARTPVSEPAAYAGRRIEERRIGVGYTREAFAGVCGVGTSTLFRIERGYEEHPRMEVLGRIFRALRSPTASVRQVEAEREFEADILRQLAGV